MSIIPVHRKRFARSLASSCAAILAASGIVFIARPATAIPLSTAGELVRQVEAVNREASGRRDCNLVLASSQRREFQQRPPQPPPQARNRRPNDRQAPAPARSAEVARAQPAARAAAPPVTPAPPAPVVEPLPNTFPEVRQRVASGQDLPVSVLTPEQARRIYCRLISQVDQKNRNSGLCAERALLNAFELERMGVKTFKAFATVAAWRNWVPGAGSSLRPLVPGLPEVSENNWSYHVVNVIMIQTPNGPRPHAIDAALFNDGPVPLEDWQRMVAGHQRSAPPTVTLSTPYSHHVRNRFDELTRFNPNQLREARDKMNDAYNGALNRMTMLPPRPRFPATCSQQPVAR